MKPEVIASAASIVALTSLTGCALETVEDDSVQSLNQAATIYASASPENFWDSPGEVSVCFIAPTSEGTVGDADMAEIEGYVKQYWQPAMGLDIRFRGHCVVHSPVPSDWITAYVNWGAASTGNGVARFGVGRRLSPEARFENRTDVQIYLGAPHNRYNVLHEFGHVFGLEHEFNRSDRDFSCISGSGEERPIGSGIGITSNDPSSISNYISCGATSVPSALDLLAMEMLYPKEGVLPVACAEGCFLSDAGVILREDGSAQDSWTARGAFPWWGSNFNRLFWEEGPSELIGFDSSLFAADLGAGSHFVEYSGRTKYANAQVTGEGEVVVDTARWTAVALAAL